MAGTYIKYPGLAAANLFGTTTNDAASAGLVGETSTGTQSTYTNTAATGTYFDATSMVLTAGDWEVSGYVDYSLNTGTGMTFIVAGIGTTTGNAAPNQSFEYASTAVPSASSHSTLGVAPIRISLASSTTIYMKGACSFSGGQPQYKAQIRARRAR